MGADDEAVAVIGTAICHVIALRTADFISSKVGGGEKFDLCYDDGLLAGCDCIWRRIFDLIGGHEKGVCRWMEDAGFVEVGGTWVVNQELEGRIRAEKGEEGVVVDEEGFGLGSLGRDDGLSGRGWSIVCIEERAGISHCHNASLWRLMRCRFLASDNGCWD